MQALYRKHLNKQKAKSCHSDTMTLPAYVIEPPAVTPESICKLGAELGLDVSDRDSLYLLSVARLLLTLIPTGYKHVVSLTSEHNSLYIDKR